MSAQCFCVVFGTHTCPGPQPAPFCDVAQKRDCAVQLIGVAAGRPLGLHAGAAASASVLKWPDVMLKPAPALFEHDVARTTKLLPPVVPGQALMTSVRWVTQSMIGAQLQPLQPPV